MTAAEPARVSEQEKATAAIAAAELLRDDMRVGSGHRLDRRASAPRDRCALAQRPALRCHVAGHEASARELGLAVVALDELGELDIAIDGADQIDPQGWLVKGGGAAHTREKIVAAAARTFVVIASSEKAVESLQPPVPLELLRFGVESTLRALAPARARDVGESPDGGLIADYLGPVGDPRGLSARLDGTPGVIEHGLFAPELVSLILLARGEGVERRRGGKSD